jgi:hypothetical protein
MVRKVTPPDSSAESGAFVGPEREWAAKIYPPTAAKSEIDNEASVSNEDTMVSTTESD